MSSKFPMPEDFDDEFQGVVHCKHCGEGCTWQRTADGWRLFDHFGDEQHVCNTSAKANEFPVL